MVRERPQKTTLKHFRDQIPNAIIASTSVQHPRPISFRGFLCNNDQGLSKRYGLDALGAWTSEYFTTLELHYLAGAVFTFFCFFHVFIHALEGDFDIVPRKGDLRASIAIVKAMITGGEEPPSAKYLPEQRLAWAAFAGAFALVIATGLLKTLKNFAGWDLPDPALFWLALGHNLGMALTIVLFIGHMAAFLFKPNRALLPSMTNGTVDAE